MANSVTIGEISFSQGFSDGFENQNRLLLSSTYNLILPSITEGVGVIVSSTPISAIYNIPSVSVDIKFGVDALPLSASYNINDAIVNVTSNIAISAGTLSANYNLMQPQTLMGLGQIISASNLNSTYSLNTANVRFGTTIIPNILSANYKVNIPTVSGASSVSIIASILSASYNSNNVSIKADTKVLADILSAFYYENSPSIIEGLGLITSAGILNAQYNLTDVSISSTIKNFANTLSASYNVNNVSVVGNAKAEVDILDSTYSLKDSNIYVQTVVTGDVLNVTYTLEDANVLAIANYTFSADVCSATYNINSPEVIIAIPEWINCPQVPFNSYWRDDTECKDNERFLYNSLLTDSYNKFAPIWQYYPTTYDLVTDRVFKEDSNRKVIRCFSASGMIEDIPAEHRSYKLEGLVGNDIVRAWFSQAHFTEASTYSGLSPNIYPSWAPAVGDYLYLTSNGLFYEVINVNDAIELFMNRSHNWELVMRVYRDNKLTVSAGSPTLVNDVILQVCTSAASATTQFSDYLEINEDLNDLIKPIEYDEQSGEQPVNPFGGW